MESFATNKDLLFEKVENYANTSIDLLKLNTVEKSADVLSSLTSVIVIFMIVAMFTLFVNIGVSLYIGKLLHDNYLGFFIVSLFYLVIAIVAFIFRHKLLKIPVSNMVISKLLKKIDLDEVIEKTIQ